jgi:hypothetical protein
MRTLQVLAGIQADRGAPTPKMATPNLASTQSGEHGTEHSATRFDILMRWYFGVTVIGHCLKWCKFLALDLAETKVVSGAILAIFPSAALGAWLRMLLTTAYNQGAMQCNSMGSSWHVHRQLAMAGFLTRWFPDPTVNLPFYVISHGSLLRETSW